MNFFRSRDQSPADSAADARLPAALPLLSTLGRAAFRRDVRRLPS